VLDAEGSTIPSLDTSGIGRLVEAGTATAGMIAKLSACRDAVRQGVGEVLIASGHDLAIITALVRQGSRSGGSGYTVIVREREQTTS
jgi:acetylglutamate kinase